MNRPVNPLIAELNKELEQLFVDQEDKSVFRAPNFRKFSPNWHNLIQTNTGMNGLYHPACCVVRAEYHLNGMRYQ